MANKRRSSGTRPLKIIVKVQRAIISTEEVAPVLIYNQDRSILIQQPESADIRAMFRKGEYKFYATAELNRGQLAIDKRVPDQPW